MSDRHGHRRRHRALAIAPVVLAALAVAVALPACKEKAQQGGGAAGGGGGRAGGPVPVALGEVVARPAPRTIEAVGTLYADEEVVISNKVPGRVIAIYKDVGDTALPGEPLAQLLPNDYELDRRAKESALREALAKLGLSEPPGPDFDVESLPSVRRARLQAENARSRYERGKILHDQDPPLLSDQDFADLKTAWDVAQTGYEVERLAAGESLITVQTRLVDLAIATQALADTVIRAPRLEYGPAGEGVLDRVPVAAAAAAADPSTRPATTQPFAGAVPALAPTTAPADPDRRYLVSARMASTGLLANAVTPMFRLVDLDPIKLRAHVPERYQAMLAVGQEVDVRVEAFPDPFRGRIARISPYIDPANRTLMVEAVIPNPDARLYPGAFARATIHVREDPGAVFVPASAIVSFAGVDKVFLVRDGKAVERPIEPARFRDGDLVEIRSGVKPGERIVVEGAQRLATGTPVTVREGGAAPSTRPAAGGRSASAAAAASPK